MGFNSSGNTDVINQGFHKFPASTGSPTSETKIYEANDTWTKPSWAKFVLVTIIGGGGGGGSGRQGAAASNRYGGGGGASGAVSQVQFAATALPSTVGITVGGGGTGGAAQGTASNNGNIGNAGSPSQFGTLLKALGGNAGGAGTNASAGAAGATVNPVSMGIHLLGATRNSSTATAANETTFIPTGGGTGGNILNVTTNAGGSPVTWNLTNIQVTAPLFAAGGTPAGSGNQGTNGTDLQWGWNGGGGAGGASGDTGATVNGGAGGNGGKYGGGGGGGGASTDGKASGKGGDGGTGAIIVTSWA